LASSDTLEIDETASAVALICDARVSANAANSSTVGFLTVTSVTPSIVSPIVLLYNSGICRLMLFVSNKIFFRTFS